MIEAIILAAGKGKRLGKIGSGIPKCLLKIGNDSLLTRYLNCLVKAGINKVRIVTGFNAGQIEAELKNYQGPASITTHYNPDFLKGNLLSVLVAGKPDSADILLMDADVYFDQEILTRIIDTEHKNCFLLDDKVELDAESMKLAVKGNRVIKISRDLSGVSYDKEGEGVGFARMSTKTYLKLLARIKEFAKAGKTNMEYEEVLDIILSETDFGFELVGANDWVEIDFEEDLEQAKRIFGRSRG